MLIPCTILRAEYNDCYKSVTKSTEIRRSKDRFDKQKAKTAADNLLTVLNQPVYESNENSPYTQRKT